MARPYGKTFASQGITTGAKTPGTSNSSSPVLMIPPDLIVKYSGDDSVPVFGFPSSLVQGVIGSNGEILLPMTVELKAFQQITNGQLAPNTANLFNNDFTQNQMKLRLTIQQQLAKAAQQVQTNIPSNTTSSQTDINNQFQELSGFGTGVSQTILSNPQKNNDLSINRQDLARKVNAMNQLPPLAFLINPTTFSQSLNKKTEEFFTRAGWNQEFWGEELDTFTLEGQIGGTFTDKFGLSRFFRRDSSSYQNLMQLYLYYKNNGRVFEDLDPRRIAVVANVVITYDSVKFIGMFDSFEITETADQPFNLKYDFTFTARQTLLPSF